MASPGCQAKLSNTVSLTVFNMNDRHTKTRLRLGVLPAKRIQRDEGVTREEASALMDSALPRASPKPSRRRQSRSRPSKNRR